MAGGNKILVVSSYRSGFVLNDVDILSLVYPTRFLHLTSIRSNPVRFCLGVFNLIWRLSRTDLVYVFFADFNAFLTILLARLFRCKIILFVGGYETAALPELNYGGRLQAATGSRLKISLRLAHRVLAFSDFSRREIIELVPGLKVDVLAPGIDTEKFSPLGEKEKIVVTVGNATRDSYLLKGLLLFARCAGELKNYRFVIIGKYELPIFNLLRKAAPELIFTGQLTSDQVLSWMQKARVYCQLSVRESFGIACAEAMSCGCVPVVTRAGALPDVTGDTGFIAEQNDPEQITHLINKARRSRKGRVARERIIGNYSNKIRQTRLLNLIYELYENNHRR
ncbi:MAG: glycosyltransferase family 4 protein [Candidatus Cloacimonetes bacterium]|nr:glycosyltransferase family 4 protein [Candidatus Cloacimonadota bacterium]